MLHVPPYNGKSRGKLQKSKNLLQLPADQGAEAPLYLKVRNSFLSFLQDSDEEWQKLTGLTRSSSAPPTLMGSDRTLDSPKLYVCVWPDKATLPNFLPMYDPSTKQDPSKKQRQASDATADGSE